MASSSADQIEGQDQRSKCSADSCNFFSNEHTDGLCSQCYKNKMSALMMEKSTSLSFIEKKPISHLGAPGPREAQSTPTAFSTDDLLESPCPIAPSPVLDRSEASDSEPPPEPPRKKNRCFTCRKKVGLLGYECKCGKLLCAAHRQAEEHQCEFDHRQAGRMKLAEDNPLIACPKVERV